MYMPSPEMSKILTMEKEEVFLEIVSILRLAWSFQHHIREEPEMERLMICFRSIYFRKRKPRIYESFREDLVVKINDSFDSEVERDKFLGEFGKMWDDWCYAWRYVR